MRLRFRLRPWMVVSALWIAPAIFGAIDQAAQRRLHGDPPASVAELLWSGGDWLIYAFVIPPIFAIASRWPITRPTLVRRSLLHLGFALLFCVVWALGGKMLQLLLVLVFDPQRVRTAMAAAGDHAMQQVVVDVLGWISTTLPFGIVVYLGMAGMAHAIRYFSEASDREIQLARLSEQLTSARFAALQAQLNPHFLFNTLNTIAVRARDGDGAGTVRMVEQLSDLLRRTLSRHRANEVTLEEELDLVRQYLAIEQARYSDRLQPTYAIDGALDTAAVPSFAVQHLVENAIRHGITKRSGAGQVRIGARRDGDVLEVTVADDGAGIAPDAGPVQGHGLENTRERLRALYGDRATLIVVAADRGGTIATLRVPYHEIALEGAVA